MDNSAIIPLNYEDHPNAPKYLHIAHFILCNQPVHIDEIAEKINTTINAVYSSAKNIRKYKNFNFDMFFNNGQISMKIRGNTPTIDDINGLANEIIRYKKIKLSPKKTTYTLEQSLQLQKDIIEMLSNSKLPIHSNMITRKLKITIQHLYNIIAHLKKKGYVIKSNGQGYKLLSKPEDINLQTELPISQPLAIIHQPENINYKSDLPLIPKSYIKKIALLSESEKHDVLDMLKKAYYYQKTAMTLIEANDKIKQLSEMFFNIEEL